MHPLRCIVLHPHVMTEDGIMTKTNMQQIVAEAIGNYIPNRETIKILKGVSKNFDVEMPVIKEIYNGIIESRSVQNLNVESEVDRERCAARILIAELTDGKNQYTCSIDVYCDFLVELSIIRDHIIRTSIKMVDKFGKEYGFHGTLEEIDRVRNALEDKMDSRFFGDK